jgi:hypothetical protein
MSGIACASKLLNAGFAVTLFDKGRHLGGRLASRDRDEYTFDYGAQYFTARDARFKEFLEMLLKSGNASIWDGKFAKSINGRLTEEFAEEPRYVGVPLMRSLAAAGLDPTIDCLISHRVTDVQRQNGEWRLTGVLNENKDTVEHSFTMDGYDLLVLSLPAAQAAALHPNPELSSIRFRPCLALLLAFSERIDISFDGIMTDDKMISWCARDSSKPGRENGERWVIHASPDWSEENFNTSEDEIKRHLIDRFASSFGLIPQLPPVLFAKVHKWRYALPVSSPPNSFIVEQESAVAYCGDWCSGARVEAAFLSGISTADEIIRQGKHASIT